MITNPDFKGVLLNTVRIILIIIGLVFGIAGIEAWIWRNDFIQIYIGIIGMILGISIFIMGEKK